MSACMYTGSRPPNSAEIGFAQPRDEETKIRIVEPTDFLVFKFQRVSHESYQSELMIVVYPTTVAKPTD